MSRHVSVVMRDDLFKLMEDARGRESKSSFINFVLEQHFNDALRRKAVKNKEREDK